MELGLHRPAGTVASRPRRFDLAPLAHPLWWAALALLALNDNLLKGHGLAPAWLTGKLSDFAFLVVAPVVFAAMLPRALPGRRPFAIAAVVGVYVAADLSAVFSDAVVALAARAGLRWRLWPDPTDLVALAVLPLTTRLLYGEHPHATQRARWLRERAGVVLGAAACLATSALPGYQHNPFLLNATAASTTIRITWLLRAVGQHECDDAATVAASLNANDLDDAREFTLETGQVAGLDQPAPPGRSPAGVCTVRPNNVVRTECVAAILEAPEAAPVLMIAPGGWSESEQGGGLIDCSCSDPPPAPRSLCEPMLDPAHDPGPEAVTLKDVGGGRRFVAGAKLQLVPIDLPAVAARTPDPNGCRNLREQYRALSATPSACTADTDCLGRAGLQIPTEPSLCGIYVSTAVASMIADLDHRWSEACVIGESRSCGILPQPAVCRSGQCAPLCPDAPIPTCGYGCDNFGADKSTVGTSCAGEFACIRAGTLCQCVGGAVACADRPACPVHCLNAPGGGTFDRSQLDAGAVDAGAPDAATPVDSGADL